MGLLTEAGTALTGKLHTGAMREEGRYTEPHIGSELTKPSVPESTYFFLSKDSDLPTHTPVLAPHPGWAP